MVQAAKKDLWFRCGRYFLRTVKREDASDRWAELVVRSLDRSCPQFGSARVHQE